MLEPLGLVARGSGHRWRTSTELVGPAASSWPTRGVRPWFTQGRSLFWCRAGRRPDPVPYKRRSPPQRVLRQAPGWFTECPPLALIGVAAHHPKIRKIHLLRHCTARRRSRSQASTVRRRIRSQRVSLRWRPMGAPFHDAAQRPGRRCIGFRAGPRGRGPARVLGRGRPREPGRRTRTLPPRNRPPPAYRPGRQPCAPIPPHAPPPAETPNTHKGARPTPAGEPGPERRTATAGAASPPPSPRPAGTP